MHKDNSMSKICKPRYNPTLRHDKARIAPHHPGPPSPSISKSQISHQPCCDDSGWHLTLSEPPLDNPSITMVSRSAARYCIRSLRSLQPSPQINRPFTACGAKRWNSSDTSKRQTHFGYETVTEAEKQEKVAGVFTNVAESYDKMNDLMSMGVHRLWKYTCPFHSITGIVF